MNVDWINFLSIEITMKDRFKKTFINFYLIEEE